MGDSKPPPVVSGVRVTRINLRINLRGWSSFLDLEYTFRPAAEE
jgi:hypothetical protein